jgi:hypothetical protein
MQGRRALLRETATLLLSNQLSETLNDEIGPL